MNEDFSRLQQLLRLKRYEQPPPGFFDEVAAEARRRRALPRGIAQRFVDSLRRLAEAVNKRTVIAWGAGAYAALMLLLWLWPKPVPHGDGVLVVEMPGAGAQANPGRQGNPQTIQVGHGVEQPPPKEIEAPPGLPRTQTQGSANRDSILGPKEEPEEAPADDKDGKAEQNKPRKTLPGPKEG